VSGHGNQREIGVQEIGYHQLGDSCGGPRAFRERDRVTALYGIA
jgi:hypothetical protein